MVCLSLLTSLYVQVYLQCKCALCMFYQHASCKQLRQVGTNEPNMLTVSCRCWAGARPLRRPLAAIVEPVHCNPATTLVQALQDTDMQSSNNHTTLICLYSEAKSCG